MHGVGVLKKGPSDHAQHQRPRGVALILLTTLAKWDTAVFKFLNGALHCRVLDVVMPFITAEENWRIPLVLALLAIVVLGGKRSRMTAIGMVIAVAVADQSCARVLKELFGRVRPCHVVEGVRLLNSCRGSPSFPSCHAVNSTAVAVVALLRHRKWTAPALVVAFLAGYSRVYVGVHYPSDVVGGMMLGALIGFGIVRLARFVEDRLASRKQP